MPVYRPFVGAAVLAAAACAPMTAPAGTAGAPSADGVARRLAAREHREPVDYADPRRWACSSERERDVCRDSYRAITVAADGTTVPAQWLPAPAPPVDCFYVYPTVDFSAFAGNHDDLDDVVVPTETVRAQAAPFASVCRVFAPYYRQATLFSYAVKTDEALASFRRAFVDVAAAFEYYLRHDNGGRPIVLLGHSQGAQMTSYLLHMYFDGDTAVTTIDGSRRSSDLRRRLVVALPIGFDLFVPRGADRGGTLADVPVCRRDDQVGCFLHYRSFAEGAVVAALRPSGTWPSTELAAAGYSNRAFTAGDEVVCSNPATEATRPGLGRDIHGGALGDGDVRVLSDTIVLGVVSTLSRGGDAASDRVDFPRRYTATCRSLDAGNRYLAIGYYEPGPTDARGDPLMIKADFYSSRLGSELGLHIFDFTLAMGDLIRQVRTRTDAFLNAHLETR